MAFSLPPSAGVTSAVARNPTLYTGVSGIPSSAASSASGPIEPRRHGRERDARRKRGGDLHQRRRQRADRRPVGLRAEEACGVRRRDRGLLLEAAAGRWRRGRQLVWPPQIHFAFGAEQRDERPR